MSAGAGGGLRGEKPAPERASRLQPDVLSARAGGGRPVSGYELVCGVWRRLWHARSLLAVSPAVLLWRASRGMRRTAPRRHARCLATLGSWREGSGAVVSRVRQAREAGRHATVDITGRCEGGTIHW